MNEKSVAVEQINVLKKKLDAAIKSRAAVDSDLKSQSSLLVQFITRLTKLCKGIDKELDSRLGKLKKLLAKGAPIADLEQQIAFIAKIIQNYELKTTKEINQLNRQCNDTAKALLKINTLPTAEKQELRNILKEYEQSKETLVQYIPVLSQLVKTYDTALKLSPALPKKGLLDALNNGITTEKKSNESQVASQVVLAKLTYVIDHLVLPEKHTSELLKIKDQLTHNISNDKLMVSLLDLFDVIITDLQQEKATAESFLCGLSETLSDVQNAINKTLFCNKESQSSSQELNARLHKQVDEMSTVVDSAKSISDLKQKINQNLQSIVKTLEDKTNTENQHNQQIENQLNSMTDRVRELEKQSQVFEEQLKQQKIKSMQDALTKLNNRAAFDDYFSGQLQEFHQQAYELALVILDLDDFKRINDTYGHTAGDKTLQVMAMTLTKKVSPGAFIARYGGEEFVLVYSGETQEQLLKHLNDLRKHIARLPFKFKNNKVSITTSIGVTHIKAQDNIHSAFERADKALYQAKDQGKNRVVYL
ncbi:diguanylate cyclase [Thalassomonas viridans]|uniref:diguanylate cyclase n=1 Tax=Thalassomonas viridans TaxID=137584 RepID=A0AAE9Z605_9GAMM|nr:diguanylate cyclase [Thalassomonas viridans]WDE06907.1 diguanylate cyclase [Thalassomonas viridans]